VVNGATAENIHDVLKVLDDLSDISAIMQEETSREEGKTAQGEKQ
jgi:hypothetical protein